MDEMILIGDLPGDLVAGVGRDLAEHTVAFLDVEEAAMARQEDLRGSGILVAVEGTRAILTAQHVVRLLPRSGRLGLFPGQTNTPHTIDTDGIAFLEIARGARDALGPDLGALVLAPSIASAIGAKKTFYSLTSRREQALHSPPYLRDGAWFANGFLAERSIVTHDPGGFRATRWLYHFCGVGGPDSSLRVAEHDYFEFPVSYEARAKVPSSWGGMSGGGLWQVPLKRQGDSVVPLSPLLSGILFYQHPTTPTQCGVRAHGRRSVYEVAYESIRGREP